MKRRTAVLYPFLLGLYPVLALYAHNMDQLALSDLVAPGLAVVGLAGIVLVILRFICGGWARAGMPAALTVLLFFAYGHIHMPLKQLWPTKITLTGAVLLVSIFAATVCVVVLVRRLRGQLASATLFLNVVSVSLFVVPLLRIAAYELLTPGQARAIRPGRAAQLPGTETADDPNILYIIVDRYPSASTLQEVYLYDNAPFLDSLRRLGFVVADESRCNYARTDMSLASSLNMTYLDDLLDQSPGRQLGRALHQAIRNNEVVSLLKARGYRYLHFGAWWRATSWNRLADRNYNRLLLPEFVMMLYRTTMVYPLGVTLGFDARREQWSRVHYQFDMLESLDSVPGPVFAFVHFLLPHEPYVLSREGHFVGRFAQIRRGTQESFVDQVVYANRRLLAVSNRLTTARGARKWVIVIQSDEGPHPPENFTFGDSLQTLRARFRILNAYHLPAAGTVSVRPSITPVNTFRMLFDGYFGTEYGLLPDESYLDDRGRVRNVTDMVRYQ